MYFIILQANLELFKLLKSKEFSTPYPPPLGGLRANPPHPTPPQKKLGWGGGANPQISFYDWKTLNSLFQPLSL